jgi:hypothetical protein
MPNAHRDCNSRATNRNGQNSRRPLTNGGESGPNNIEFARFPNKREPRHLLAMVLRRDSSRELEESFEPAGRFTALAGPAAESALAGTTITPTS